MNLPDLTERELELLALAHKGVSRMDIASELGIAPSTVKNHISHIVKKFGVTRLVEAVEEWHFLQEHPDAMPLFRAPRVKTSHPLVQQFLNKPPLWTA